MFSFVPIRDKWGFLLLRSWSYTLRTLGLYFCTFLVDRIPSGFTICIHLYLVKWRYTYISATILLRYFVVIVVPANIEIMRILRLYGIPRIPASYITIERRSLSDLHIHTSDL